MGVMKRLPRAAVAALLALLAARVPARAMRPEDEQVARRGLDALFNADYDQADRLFMEALQARPGDPALSLGAAASAWWRMENDFALPGSPEERKFSAAVEGAISDAKAAARQDDAEAYLYLGAAYGLRGRWEAARKRWFSAYLDGRRSYKAEKKAVKLNPELYDAYLGLGAFDYYVATLSRVVRALAFTSGGDKGKGLSELKLAAEKGRFSPAAAKLLLAGLDWTFEKNPQDAWALCQELHARYPDSPLIDSMRLIGLFHLRDGAGLERGARAFLKKAEDGAPHFTAIDAVAGRYFVGLGEELEGRFPEAIADFQKALEKLPAGHRWRGMLELFTGECLDAQGRRDEAAARYKRALSEPPLWGVPRYAKFLLKHPYRPGDNPLPARTDELE